MYEIPLDAWGSLKRTEAPKQHNEGDLTQGAARKECYIQYDIDDLRNIWWKVCCVNDVPQVNKLSIEAKKKLLIGPTGHVERCNVWSHAFAVVLFVVYQLIRPFTPMGQKDSTSNALAYLSLFLLTVTYSCSVVFHVYSANKYWSGIARVGDYTGIYLGIAGASTADLSLTTLNLEGVPWQSVSDIWISMAMVTLFFAYRRACLTPDQTRVSYLENKCSIGLARSNQSDLQHSSLRACVGLYLAFQWILFIPGAHATLGDHSWLFSGSRILSTVLLVFGMAFDNIIIYPDQWVTSNDETPRSCVCYSQKEGCGGGWVVTSHAWWHFIALLSTVISVIGTEYVLLLSDVV